MGSSMKTTLELPDDLLRRLKLRAGQHNCKLKDEIAQLLETGLAHAPATIKRRNTPKPIRLRGRHTLTLRDIESAIASGRGRLKK